MVSELQMAFDNSYAEKLEGFYVPWEGAKVPKPEIIQFNDELALSLGLNPKEWNSEKGAQIFAGNEVPEGAAPIAQVYAGHQFGGFSPQLGDGRALLIGEVLNKNGERKDIQLKGSGRTPFSRNGDGKAVIGPVLREYLMGEAMHALGVPTTRALAAVTTGEQIIRDGFQPGAVLVRVASSHIRVGTFQFFAARKDQERIRQLADYSIERHYPEIKNSDQKYLEFLKAVMERQAHLVAKWISTGFVHGVMNTDNMTISGETIDYGPCAFMDTYNPATVFSSIDEQGRYAYGNQPVMAQWNLARFAETLIELIDPEDTDHAIKLATDTLNLFPEIYQGAWASEMHAKLGLSTKNEDDMQFINALHEIIKDQKIDYTSLFRKLSDVLRGKRELFLALFEDDSIVTSWLDEWVARIEESGSDTKTVADRMDEVNPIYIPRNHLVEEALKTASQQADFEPFKQLLDVVSNPFEKRPGFEKYEAPAAGNSAPYITYCGT